MIELFLTCLTIFISAALIASAALLIVFAGALVFAGVCAWRDMGRAKQGRAV